MQERMPVPSNEPQAVEQALMRLRQASLAGVSRGLPAVRATVYNLVAYAGSQALASRMSDWIAGLAESQPSRAIILGHEPRARTDLETTVAARCHPALAGRLVCIEEIVIMATREAEERLATIVLSLLLRDLPTALWWPGDLPLGSTLFERLSATADRLLADSASARDPRALLRQLVAMGHAAHCQCIIGDLNWDRLTPWRELIAQFFDPSDCRPCLDRLDHLHIEYLAGEHGGGLAAAYLLVAWLATRLGWRPAPEPMERILGGELLHLMRGEEPVDIELISLPQAAPAEAALQSLSLHARIEEGDATFAIRRTGAAEADVTTSLPRSEPRSRTVTLPSPHPGQLLAQQLARAGFDPSYPEALRMAAYFSAQTLAPVPFFG